ncbi:MAG TPA: GH92 family glycosyl hydrolase [Kiritimatiellia bacterium]|nr:GH92 family glycosyl hydrolase [Kiritimatiellia bacterium]HPS08199.1 GH92 family glycosyl hydrolase [Kiritimatiellia bacterium]
MKNGFGFVSRRAVLAAGVAWSWVAACAADAQPGLSHKVDTLIGVVGHGSCMPGPCLPHASIYPSLNTLKPTTSGFVYGDDVVGFAQLHTQGTGGTPTYGNFLVSPRLGPGIAEKDQASPLADVATAPFAYRARLTRWDTRCTVVPAAHSALYRFEFPVNEDARLVFNVARKIGKATALTNGTVTIDPASGTITGGGTFDGNWNPAPYRLFFAAKVDAKPVACGTWTGSNSVDGATSARIEKREGLGAWLRFDARQTRTVHLKIAVSFTSAERAAQWLDQEIPAWDLDALQAQAEGAWDHALAAIAVDGMPEAEQRLFYTHFFHSMVQPRDRTGDADGWPVDAPCWDDHYTLWDTWKTLFPLMAIVRPDVVASNVRSFSERLRLNGQCAAAFIQGKEYRVGQGGDEADNVIGDAYAKQIPGIDWNAAWEVLAANAGRRTEDYRTRGWVAHKGKHDYCGRMKSGSGTIGFAYNDWCAAQVAAGLGKAEEAQRLLARSRNWRNVWDDSLADSGFTGFIRARNADGTFQNTEARKGYNTDFYEGTCWQYSYVLPHDVPGMIEKMGGKATFIERLQFALSNGLIDFGNEPSFMTIWLFDHVQRPYLASYWADKLRGLFTQDGPPGDDDSGAMGSLYVFLDAGFFPFAGQDTYYLHGPRAPRFAFRQPNGKTFTVTAENAGGNRIYIQSATLNGKPLDAPVIRHRDIVAGGTLAFVMGDTPSAWGCAGEFDPALARQQTK